MILSMTPFGMKQSSIVLRSPGTQKAMNQVLYFRCLFEYAPVCAFLLSITASTSQARHRPVLKTHSHISGPKKNGATGTPAINSVLPHW